MAKMNRKGVFFSIVSVFIITIFYLSFSMSTERRMLESEMEATRTRVDVLNSIVNDLESRYLERMLYVASYSALGSMSRYSVSPTGCPNRFCGPSNNFLGFELGASFKDLNTSIFEGKIHPNAFSSIDLPSGYGITQQNLQAQLAQLAIDFENLGLKIEGLSFEVTTFEQKDPWTVVVGATISYDFRDESKVASWKGKTHKQVEVDIRGFMDPLYGSRISDQDYLIDTTNQMAFPICTFGEDCQHSPSYINKLRGETTADSVAEDLGFGICLCSYEYDTVSHLNCNNAPVGSCP